MNISLRVREIYFNALLSDIRSKRLAKDKEDPRYVHQIVGNLNVEKPLPPEKLYKSTRRITTMINKKIYVQILTNEPYSLVNNCFSKPN